MMSYKYLGTFRLLLALLVVVQHALVTMPQPLSATLEGMEIGSTAVLMFFILSGYIIADAYHGFYERRPGAFLVNRVVRIYPTYLAALALFVVGVYLTRDVLDLRYPGYSTRLADGLTPTNILSNALALLPLHRTLTVGSEHVDLLSIVWAVRVEFLFYLLFFCVCWAARAVGLSTAKGLLLLAPAMLVAFLAQHASRHPTAFQFAPYFALGLAVFYATRPATPDAPRTHRDSLVAGAVALASFALLSVDALGRSEFHETGFPRHVVGQYVLLLALIALWLALLRFSHEPSARLARWRDLDRRIGEVTYPLYLNHQICLLILMAAMPRSWSTFELALVLSLAMGVLATRMLEPRIALLRNHIRGRAAL